LTILVVGFGSIGRRHFQNLRSLGRRDLAVLRSGRSTLPEADSLDCPVVTTMEAALELRPEAAVIATPTAVHLDAALPLAQAGCHLLIEKPLSHSMRGVALLRQSVEESGARVQIGFQYRFHPGLQYLKQQLEAGSIGRPIYARAFWGEYLPDWHPWEDYRNSYSARRDLGGGVVLTLCHPLDYLRWLLGETQQISALVDHVSDLELDVEDLAEITLRFEQGCVGSVHLDYFQSPAVHGLEILGSAGSLRWEASCGAVSRARADTGQDELLFTPQEFERNDMFLAEMKHFLRVVAGEESPVCSLDDGIEALRMSMAAIESSGKGKAIHLLEYGEANR